MPEPVPYPFGVQGTCLLCTQGMPYCDPDIHLKVCTDVGVVNHRHGDACLPEAAQETITSVTDELD
jgi:hypothetical protein